MPAWFTEITRESGIDFIHASGAAGRYHMPEIMGSGAAMFDFDNDGDLDIYLINGNHSLPSTTPAEAPTNRLWRQDEGGKFTDVTEQSGLGDGGYGMGVAIGDYDNDGDLDVYITNWGPDRLYRNNGNGIFADVTDACGININDWSCSAAFFDYDRDGHLDLYVARYLEYDADVLQHGVDGARDYLAPSAFPSVSDVLLHNNGDGTFTDVSESAGIAAARHAGLGAVCEDFNDDGWIDVYVTNDAHPNNLWRNNRDGTFTDVAIIMGCAYNLHGQPEAGMGVVAADLDHDLNLDLYMTHTVAESNTYYRNAGGERGFSDATGEAGLAASSMPFTGFGAIGADVELDGDVDLIVVNGRVQRAAPHAHAALDPPWDAFGEPNLLYINDGRGRFRQSDALGGDLCAEVEVTRGLAMGDLDNDGDIDLILSNIDGPARVFRNDAPRSGGAWLVVRAIDPALNRDAIGARITLTASGRALLRTINPASSYLSSNDVRAHFGLGDASSIDVVEIRWVDGLSERFERIEINSHVTLKRGEGIVQAP